MPENGDKKDLCHCSIRTWAQFAREVRSKGCNLLARLDEFPQSVLVTGCQRSGTTMLSRIIRQSEGMVNYQFCSDDELAAALILSGHAPHTPKANGRYCFQTTYVNECVREYYRCINGHKIIWVLRNPYSVVHSMLYNWESSALNRLFMGCGIHFLNQEKNHRYGWLKMRRVSKLQRACLSYCGKVSQVFELKEWLKLDRMVVVDYDDLVKDKDEILPIIYGFIDLAYKSDYPKKIHSRSLNRFSSLSKRELAMIEEWCVPIYDEAKELAVTSNPPNRILEALL